MRIYVFILNFNVFLTVPQKKKRDVAPVRVPTLAAKSFSSKVPAMAKYVGCGGRHGAAVLLDSDIEVLEGKYSIY